MLTAYLFDKQRGAEIDEWTDVLSRLGKNQVLWVDVVDPSEPEERAVWDGFDLGDSAGLRIGDSDTKPTLDQNEGHIRVTAVAVSADEKEPAQELVVVDCFVGPNWVITTHAGEIAVIDEFRDLATGGSELGVLDASSVLASMLEWVVTSYSRAFDEVEATLEKFDVDVLHDPRKDTEAQISVLVETRSRVGRLRRSLAPHREIFAALAHPELDLISTELSAERFEKLAAQVDAALSSARDAKDAVVNSFDVLILRAGHRTNEIVKVLTLASILLLPGTLIAGVMGMNVNFGAGVFAHSRVFWVALALIVSLAVATLGLARWRRWI